MWQGSYKSGTASPRRKKTRRAPGSAPQPPQASKASLRHKARQEVYLKRVTAEVEVLDEERELLGLPRLAWKTRIILNDISVTGMGIFSSVPCLPGQELVIRLNEPRPFYLKGRVVWCREYETSNRVMSESRFVYRVGIRFDFATQEEERVVQGFCDFLMREHLARIA